MRFHFIKITSYCLGLCTQNPGLRKVDLEPSPMIGSDKINMLKKDRKTAGKKHIIQMALTYGSRHLERQTSNAVLREERIEPNLKRTFTDPLEACIVNILRTKSKINQPGSTLSYHLELEKSLTKSPSPMVLSI